MQINLEQLQKELVQINEYYVDYIGPVISATLPSGLDEKEEATLMEEQRETDIAKVNIGH